MAAFLTVLNLFCVFFSAFIAYKCAKDGNYGLCALNFGASMLNVVVVAARCL
jgi:hypothetical protein